MSFLDELVARRERARQRVETCRRNLAEAERELQSWTAAVTLESRSGEVGNAISEPPSKTNGKVHAETVEVSLTPEDARSKRGVLIRYFTALNRPLKAGELVNLVKPAMSRASLYALLPALVEEGIIDQDREGRYSLKQAIEKEATISDLLS